MKCSKQLLVTMLCGEHRLFKRFSQFKHGANSVEVCAHSGCPSTSCTDDNMEEVSKLVNEDWRSTISETTGSASHVEHVCKFQGRTWTCVGGLQPFCLVSLLMSKNKIKFSLLKTWLWSPTLLTHVLCPIVILSFLKRKSSYESIYQGSTWNSGTICDCPTSD
jgi:hypothetical protein